MAEKRTGQETVAVKLVVDWQQVAAGWEEGAGQFEVAERAAGWTVGKACEDTVPECTKYII